MTAQLRRVAITQPYIPAYRFPLWDRVVSTLADQGVETRIFFGGDDAQLALRAERGDGVEAPWAQQVAVRAVALTDRLPKLRLRRLPREWAHGALLVTEMEGANLNAWAAAARRHPFITFGHGRSYTTEEGGLSARVENALNRRARHVLTYTEAGREAVLARTGRAPHAVTAFRNTTDTATLRRVIAATTPTDTAAFQLAHGIPEHAKIALYLGALGRHKRIGLLAEAAERVFAQDPDWWLVVAGAGEDAPTLRALAARTGRVVLLGQAAPADYAPAARIARLVVNPGRIGLVAVDALVMGLPILAARSGLNAPEAEYLREGKDVVTVDDSAAAVAAAWLGWSVPRSEGPSDSLPTIESAAEVISHVILHELTAKAAHR
jgi:glycosyltransferase involved in cell wall biosynthesis